MAPYHGEGGARALWLRAEDGLRLRAAVWPLDGARGTVLLFPGRTEVVEKYAEVAGDLRAAGWAVAAVDWRGQGLSDRAEGVAAEGAFGGLGHVGDFAEYQRDVAAFRAVGEGEGWPKPWVMLAHSMGGCIGLRALLGGLDVAAAAFSAPMWGLPVGRAAGLAVRGLARLGPAARRPVPGAAEEYALGAMSFDDNMLTTDRARFAAMQAQVAAHPALALGAPTLGWLAAALAEMAALRVAASPDLPAFAAVGSREKIVSAAAVAERMGRWPGAGFARLKGAEHELLMEADRHRRPFLDAVLGLYAGV